ncbi:carbohydrate-binding protein [Bradyrhizobium sp. LA2.1]|uniref:carbohydrate-binding protein n=1 Tax=Bradyrhizobium sp. LA2.1 TaxID=3156376 RepID=UPI003392D3B4
MTALSSYSTGTIAVSADGTTVTGTSTLWLNTGNVKPGDRFQAGHFEAIITDVVDDTHLTITPWPGSTLSGASYVVWKVSQQRIVGETYAADVAKAVSAWNTSGFFVFVDINQTTPDPSLGDDGQYAFQPTTGKTWAKVAGVWSFLGIYKAFQLKGAWSGATAYAAGDVVTLSGSSYVCILDHTNHTPPNATYWQLLASKGDTGATGATGAAGTNAPTYGGTSTTSLAIGTGSKAFTTQAGLAYTNGARVRATATAGATGWLEGVATYSGTTLTITSDKISGSGTGTAWNFNVVGEPGAGDLSSANNLSDLANKATSRNNLGAAGAVKKQTFTASGTYTPSANLLYAIIECVGGGGGGGGLSGRGGTSNSTADGGGAGSRSIKFASAATIGASQTVAIGAAGSGSTGAGGAGGDTSVGTLCIGKGGSGAVGGNAAPPGGLGGVAGTGDVTSTGAPGGPGAIGNSAYSIWVSGGPGGSSPYGGGGRGQSNTSGGASAVNGETATGFGAGGAGAGVANSSSSATGGNGSPGLVIITEFCSS